MKKRFWQADGAGQHLVFWSALAGLLLWLTSAPSLRDPTVVQGQSGVVTDSEVSDGDDFFSIHGSESRFAVRTPGHAVRSVLEASRTSGNSLRFNVHLDGARFQAGSGDPLYWVESIEYLDKKYGPYESRRQRSWRDMPPADAALLRGIAYDQAGQQAAALDELAAIDLDALSTARRVQALKARGSALESLAYPDRRAVNRDDDELLVRALHDLRAAAELDTDDYQLVFWQANALETLGDYDAALALDEQVGKRWPEQSFRVTISRAANYRVRGDYPLALAELDKIERKPGETRGMMYHYHRAWALAKLGRHEEAVRELAAGLETQPDYPWAFQKRACAHGQLAQLDQAIADQRTFIAGIAQIGDAADPVKSAEARAGELHLRALENARLTNPGRPTAAACMEETGPRYARREPSRLLSGP